ncbi:YeeE/YedE family protein [Roseovarius sp. C7]|uniref:YeeE/YedE family protein n=1 Tax=Roseovarius sp. C7 TaxID=3398643 RepID=UPI0039F6854A
MLGAALHDPLLAALIGGAGGIVLGLAARLGRFCTLGAIEDLLYQGSSLRMRMWLLAMVVAGLGVFTLMALGLMPQGRTIYHMAPFSPLASALGGGLFGYGMALAGNCGFGALARAGGGDMRSWVIVLVMGMAAYAAMSGPLAGLRLWLVHGTALDIQSRDFAALLARGAGLPVWGVGLALWTVALVALLASPVLRRQRVALAWAVAVGLAIVSGWAGTVHLSRGGFTLIPIESHSFTAPLGETMLYVMTSSGGGLSFAVGSVLGVLAGALLGSAIKGHFRWEACEDPRELRRQILGAVLMGFGAVLALGCTIGQGISAMSVLSYGAPVTFLAILAGAALGLRQLISGFGRVA